MKKPRSIELKDVRLAQSISAESDAGQLFISIYPANNTEPITDAIFNYEEARKLKNWLEETIKWKEYIDASL